MNEMADLNALFCIFLMHHKVNLIIYYDFYLRQALLSVSVG